MPESFFFADEAGCFTFNRTQNVSSYFILCTIKTESCAIGQDLLELRRSMAWRDFPLKEHFHCTTDQQIVRNEVFDTICRHDFLIQATIMEKRKAQPHVKKSKANFYKYGWFYHFKHGAGKLVDPKKETLILAASIGSRKEKLSFLTSVRDVLTQTVPSSKWQADFCPSAVDPCLQVADYCAWAIQRKWERQDTRSYDLIKDRITYEYDLWSHGNKFYY